MKSFGTGSERQLRRRDDAVVVDARERFMERIFSTLGPDVPSIQEYEGNRMIGSGASQMKSRGTGTNRRLRRRDDAVVVDARERFLERRRLEQAASQLTGQDSWDIPQVAEATPLIPRVPLEQGLVFVLAKDEERDGKVPFTVIPAPQCPLDDEAYLRVFQLRGWTHSIFQENGLPVPMADQDDPYQTLIRGYHFCAELKRSHPPEFLEGFKYEDPC